MSVSIECCVFAGGGLCVGLIIGQGEVLSTVVCLSVIMKL